MERGARVLRPDRGQLCWDMVDLDSQIEADHPARVVWGFVEGLQLDELYASIKAREGVPGRPTPDPRLYLALWLYATIEGIGSARALERLCRQHAAYRWLCGRVPVNYHDLSDFRSGAGAVLDRLLGESVAALVAEGWSASTRWRSTAPSWPRRRAGRACGTPTGWRGSRLRRGSGWSG